MPYDGDESITQQYYTGYTSTNAGVTIDDVNVDERFSIDNEVWAITLNETVDEYGSVPDAISSPPGTPNPSPLSGADLYIPSLTIKQNKESWIKGKSEIEMMFGLSWDNGIDITTGGTKQFQRYKYISKRNISWDLIVIRSFTRKEIREKKSINIDFTYAPLSTWASNINVAPTYSAQIDYYYYPTKGNYLYLLIYERDEQTAYYYKNDTLDQYGNFLYDFKYFSNNGPYLQTSFKIIPKNSSESSFNSSNADFDNNEITFKSRHR